MDPPSADLPRELLYAVGQLESAPSTGALHWQFYVHLRTKRRLRGVKFIICRWLGDHATSTHLEPMRGTREECIEYCSKSDTRVGLHFSYGTVPVSKRRGDELCKFLRDGGTILDMAPDPAWDDMLLRFSSNRLRELSELLHPRKRDPSCAPLCEVHYGAPGTGKSRRVFSSFPDAYIKPSGKWWDHYSGQSIIILDDFDGSFLQFGDFKRIIDRYPAWVEVKGGVIPLLASHFCITTNVYPSHWWSLSTTHGDGRDAIWRRFTRVYSYSLEMPEPEECSPEAFRARFMLTKELEDPKKKE